jgi:hypothetical protein
LDCLHLGDMVSLTNYDIYVNSILDI